jgi:hypothetical protein
MGGELPELGNGRDRSRARTALALESRDHFVGAGVSLAEGSVAIDEPARLQAIDHRMGGLEALALGVVDHARSIQAAMQVGGQPYWLLSRVGGRLAEMIDERLLPIGRHSEDVDLVMTPELARIRVMSFCSIIEPACS